MSFYTDWIDSAEATVSQDTLKQLHAIKNVPGLVPTKLLVEASIEVLNTTDTIKCMKRSKIIKIPDSQLQEFINIPTFEDQDFKMIRSPFPSVYMDVVPPLVYQGYYDEIKEDKVPEVRVRGVMITETVTDVKSIFLSGTGEHLPVDTGPMVRMWRLCMFIPVLPEAPENTFIATFGVNEEGKIVRPQSTRLHPEIEYMHKKFVSMAIHILNYLTSPSLTLEHKEHPAALQRSRAKRDRPPLPDWYEIQYKKTVTPSDGPHKEGSKHSFRYDVRGHFMHVKKGRLAGRVFWIPAHQRGLAHSTYKPKTYVVKP